MLLYLVKCRKSRDFVPAVPVFLCRKLHGTVLREQEPKTYENIPGSTVRELIHGLLLTS